MAKRNRTGRGDIPVTETSNYKRQYSPFFYESGKPVPWVDIPSSNSSATFSQLLYQDMKRESQILDGGKLQPTRVEARERAMLPYLVTFGVYHSDQAVDAEKKYYIIYAPNGNSALASTAAIKLWRKWEKNPSLVSRGLPVDGSISTYPLLAKISTAEVISDKEFDEIWQSIRKGGKYKSAGHPQDPHTVAILDPTFDPYRGSDSLSGMQGITEY